MAESATHKRNVARVIAHAWLDDAYRAKLKKDPIGTLTAAGVKVTAKKVHVVEADDDAAYLVIPQRPAHVTSGKKAGKPITELCSTVEQCMVSDLCSVVPELCSFESKGGAAKKKTTGKTKPTPELCSIP